MNQENTSNACPLKVYKELTYIETFDGEVYVVDDDLNVVEYHMNNFKFLNI
jgi:hypothetical protein